MLNQSAIIRQFPILQQKINGQALVYLDNGATVQKPQRVIDAIANYYSTTNSNVHRGIHTLSQNATIAMEKAREKVKAYINAKKPKEINFTYGTTDAINLVATGFTSLLQKGDEIIITEIEHHSNIVPWQILAQRTGAEIKYIPLTLEGKLDLDKYKSLLTDKTKMVAVNHVSNALGIVNPVKEIIDLAHEKKAWVLVDGAQAVAQMKVDVQELDVDFYAFSGHKMYGPTGTGILYGKEEILKQMSPYRGGGEMIETVEMKASTYADLPFKFEAGTPNICGNIVLAEAIDFMLDIGMENISGHKKSLVTLAEEKLAELPEVEIYSPNMPKSGAISFNLKLNGVHPSDVGMILDKQGIAVRTGHHCCQPIMARLGILGTVRASFAVYNTAEDVDKLVAGVKKAITFLR
ncbi:Probable cysteine desulfurase [Candidatus Ornithobacterium hominis]|uniref:Cysteine desulfurase n=1 Tax=Candidatus Ornithobacterium hominis TaxID=2497989 RepID=A0A383TXD5_9FLAO|nr:cysteine desulfurase [Candidatus Ornithobacterium hominis]MCT7904546.1 cysteine desulfurase [Candidatus Ornithobacterium hominis]SZD71443.1 Probable cysteine desulfurase [Candidatus Ornithobacterium hominis]